MRLAFLCAALGGFAGLGVLDLTAGNARVGVAELLLSGANALLLTQG
jgi:hypothetical protein